jgi:hypothetical protein
MHPVLSEKQQQQLLTRILTPCYLGKKYSSMLGFILLGLATWSRSIGHCPGRKTQQYET